MVFFNGIKNEDELKSNVSNRILELCNKTKPINITSYLELDDCSFTHKGFINLDSKVKCSSDSDLSYSLFAVNYFYMFAKKVYESKVNNKYDLIYLLNEFLDEYFGSERNFLDIRVESLYRVAWEKAFCEESYNEKMNYLNIGNFREGNFATSVERSIMANNLLSFYGFDTYFCMGLIKEKEDVNYHSFNIVKDSDKFLIVDFTNNVVDSKGNNCPFIGEISNNEINGMLDTDLSKSFIVNNKEVNYKVGDIKIKKRKRI